MLNHLYLVPVVPGTAPITTSVVCRTACDADPAKRTVPASEIHEIRALNHLDVDCPFCIEAVARRIHDSGLVIPCGDCGSLGSYTLADYADALAGRIHLDPVPTHLCSVAS